MSVILMGLYLLEKRWVLNEVIESNLKYPSATAFKVYPNINNASNKIFKKNELKKHLTPMKNKSIVFRILKLYIDYVLVISYLQLTA